MFLILMFMGKSLSYETLPDLNYIPFWLLFLVKLQGHTNNPTLNIEKVKTIPMEG
jgi:hypothetical protein